MKHLEKFNWFKKNRKSKISQDIIDDICLELKDIGIMVTKVIYDGRGAIMIRRESGNVPMEWDEIKDTCLRLKDYLGKNYIDFSYYYSYKRTFRVELNEDTEINEDDLVRAFIRFKE